MSARRTSQQNAEENVKPLRHILRKPESQRSDADIKKLADFFKNIKFFAQLDPQIRQELCKVMSYDYVPSEYLVFEEGDEASLFYVILEGSIGVQEN